MLHPIHNLAGWPSSLTGPPIVRFFSPRIKSPQMWLFSYVMTMGGKRSTLRHPHASETPRMWMYLPADPLGLFVDKLTPLVQDEAFFSGHV